MSDEWIIPRNKLRRLVFFVCLCGAVTAAFFGLFGGMVYIAPYEQSEPFVPQIPWIGCVWGAVTGLIAGWFWCSRMTRAAVGLQTRRECVHKGMLWGIAAGALATILLHVVLGLIAEQDLISGLLMSIYGMIFAVPAGAIVGALCGRVFWRILSTASSLHNDPESTPAEPPA